MLIFFQDENFEHRDELKSEKFTIVKRSREVV